MDFKNTFLQIMKNWKFVFTTTPRITYWI